MHPQSNGQIHETVDGTHGHLLGEEVALGDRARPVVPEDGRDEPLSRRLADFRRVFFAPTFGAEQQKLPAST